MLKSDQMYLNFVSHNLKIYILKVPKLEIPTI